MARFLIEAGTDLDVINDNGRSTLHLAVKAGDATLVRDLIMRGCDVNAVVKTVHTHITCDIYYTPPNIPLDDLGSLRQHFLDPLLHIHIKHKITYTHARAREHIISDRNGFGAAVV